MSTIDLGPKYEKKNNANLVSLPRNIRLILVPFHI